MKIGCLVVAVATGAGLSLGCSTQREPPPPSAQIAAAADPATGAVVSGRIAGALAGAVVVLAPTTPAAFPPPADPPAMDQIQKSFVPEMLIVRSGSPVAFHSSDSELHNINVQMIGRRFAEFNRSIPPGGSFEHTFKDTGFYSVRCDIHPEMTADIFVAATPFAAHIGADGVFGFENVPPGAYRLTVYNGGAETARAIEVQPGVNQVRFDGS